MNPIQRAWAYVSRKRLRSFILFLILFVLLAGISACLTLMKSNKNSRKQSLQITQYIFFYQKDRKWTDLQVVRPSIREQD